MLATIAVVAALAAPINGCWDQRDDPAMLERKRQDPSVVHSVSVCVDEAAGTVVWQVFDGGGTFTLPNGSQAQAGFDGWDEQDSFIVLGDILVTWNGDDWGFQGLTCRVAATTSTLTMSSCVSWGVEPAQLRAWGLRREGSSTTVHLRYRRSSVAARSRAI
jgi:hypothetical protein